MNFLLGFYIDVYKKILGFSIFFLEIWGSLRRGLFIVLLYKVVTDDDKVVR